MIFQSPFEVADSLPHPLQNKIFSFGRSSVLLFKNCGRHHKKNSGSALKKTLVRCSEKIRAGGAGSSAPPEAPEQGLKGAPTGYRSTYSRFSPRPSNASLQFRSPHLNSQFLGALGGFPQSQQKSFLQASFRLLPVW